MFENSHDSFSGQFRSSAGRDPNSFRMNHGFEDNFEFVNTQEFDNSNNNPRINTDLRHTNDRQLINNMRSINNRGPLNKMMPIKNMGPINNMIPINNMGRMHSMGHNNNQGFNDNLAIHREVNYLEDERNFRTEFQSNDYITTVNHASVNFIPSDQPNLRSEYDFKRDSNQGVHQNTNDNQGNPHNSNRNHRVPNNQARGNNVHSSPFNGHVSRNPNIEPTRKLQPQIDNGRHNSGVNHKNVRENSQHGKVHDSIHSNIVPQSQIHSGNPTSHSTKNNDEHKVSRMHSGSDEVSSAPQSEKFIQGHYVPASSSGKHIPGEHSNSRQQIIREQVIPIHQISGQQINSRQQVHGQEVNRRQQMPGQTTSGSMNALVHGNPQFSSVMDPLTGRMNIGADSIVVFTYVGPKKQKANRRMKRTIQPSGNGSETDLIWKLLLGGLVQGSQNPGNGNGGGSNGQSGYGSSLFGSGGSNLFGHLLGGQHGIGFPSLLGQNRPGIGSSSILNLGGNPLYSLLTQSGGGTGMGLMSIRRPGNRTLLQGLLGQPLLG